MDENIKNKKTYRKSIFLKRRHQNFNQALRLYFFQLCMSSIHAMMVLALKKGLRIQQLNVSTVFLNEELNETIFMELL